MDSSNLNDILRTSQTQNLGLSQTLSGLMTFITVFSVIITIAFIVLWIINWLHRRKVQSAVLEIRDVLREMNERDIQRKASEAPSPETTTAGETPLESDR